MDSIQPDKTNGRYISELEKAAAAQSEPEDIWSDWYKYLLSMRSESVIFKKYHDRQGDRMLWEEALQGIDKRKELFKGVTFLENSKEEEEKLDKFFAFWDKDVSGEKLYVFIQHFLIRNGKELLGFSDDEIRNWQRTEKTSLEMCVRAALNFENVENHEYALLFLWKAVKYGIDPPSEFPEYDDTRNITMFDRYCTKKRDIDYKKINQEGEKHERIKHKILNAAGFIRQGNFQAAIDEMQEIAEDLPEEKGIQCIRAQMLLTLKKDAKELEAVVEQLLSDPSLLKRLSSSRNEVYELKSSELLNDTFILKKGSNDLKKEYDRNSFVYKVMNGSNVQKPLLYYTKGDESVLVTQRISGIPVWSMDPDSQKCVGGDMLKLLHDFHCAAYNNRRLLDSYQITLQKRDYNVLFEKALRGLQNNTDIYDIRRLMHALKPMLEYIESRQYAIVHGDAHAGNFIFAEDGKVHMLDVEKMCYDMYEVDFWQSIHSLPILEENEEYFMRMVSEYFNISKNQANILSEHYILAGIPWCFILGEKFSRKANKLDASQRKEPFSKAAQSLFSADCYMQTLIDANAMPSLEMENLYKEMHDYFASLRNVGALEAIENEIDEKLFCANIK